MTKKNQAKNSKYGVITMENHTEIGGLGTCVAELIAGNCLNKKLKKIALNDTYLQGASTKFLMSRYKIDALSVIAQVEELIGKKLDIFDKDLSLARIDTYFNEKQQEAL